MIANLVPREGLGKYYKTTIILEEDGRDIGFIQLNIHPKKFSLDEISPREAPRFETEETQEIDWNHIETKRSFEIATKIVEMINKT